MATNGLIIGHNAIIEPDLNQNWSEVLSAGADARTVEDRVLGPLALPFKLTFFVESWVFLKYLGYDVADAGSDPYTHTFTLRNTIRSFKIEVATRHTTPVVVTFTGCGAKTGTISWEKATGEGDEGFIKVELDCVAQAYSVGSSVTTLTNSALSTDPFQWRHFKATISGSEVVEVNSGNIVIDQGISEDDSRYCNSTLNRAVGELIPGVQRTSGLININLKDSTFHDFWATEAAITGTNKLEFIRGASDKLEMDMSNFRMGKAPFPSTNLEGVESADAEFTIESFTTLKATDSVATY